MAVMLVKGLAYVVAGVVLVWIADIPRWGTYAVGVWCGGNAMGYLVAWGVAKAKMMRAEDDRRARVLSFVQGRGADGTTTH